MLNCLGAKPLANSGYCAPTTDIISPSVHFWLSASSCSQCNICKGAVYFVILWVFLDISWRYAVGQERMATGLIKKIEEDNMKVNKYPKCVRGFCEHCLKTKCLVVGASAAFCKITHNWRKQKGRGKVLIYKSNQLPRTALYLCCALNNHRYWKPNLSLGIALGNSKYPINPIINAKLNLTGRKKLNISF